MPGAARHFNRPVFVGEACQRALKQQWHVKKSDERGAVPSVYHRLMPPTLLLSPAAASLSVPTAILTAVIAAVVSVVGILINNALHRSRAHDEWLREQAFETVNKLLDAAQDFHRVMFFETPHMEVEQAPFQEVQDMLDDHDWSPLNETHNRYVDALSKLKMLMNDPTTRAMLERTRENLRTTFINVRNSPFPEGSTDTVTIRDFAARHNAPFREYRKSQTDLVEHITATWADPVW